LKRIFPSPEGDDESSTVLSVPLISKSLCAAHGLYFSRGSLVGYMTSIVLFLFLFMFFFFRRACTVMCRVDPEELFNHYETTLTSKLLAEFDDVLRVYLP